MMTPDAIFVGTFGLVLAVLALVVIVLWILMPFAVFSMNRKLGQLIELEQRRQQADRAAEPPRYSI